VAAWLRRLVGEGCNFSGTAVSRHNVGREDEPMVVRTLAFILVRRVYRAKSSLRPVSCCFMAVVMPLGGTR
jgi:hypothetical protein